MTDLNSSADILSGPLQSSWRGKQAPVDPDNLEQRFRTIRRHTETICQPLETEDHVVQPAPFVSPPKWHLAHTTWFFERFLLQPLGQPAERGIRGGNLLFNSYYKSQGRHWLQSDRGHLSRPTVREVLDYRHAVSECVAGLLRAGDLDGEQCRVIDIGIHHEQQHQELLFMDIKYIFARHPQPLAYDTISRPGESQPPGEAIRWIEFGEGLDQFGAPPAGFAYDNERPRHRRWLDGFALADRLVSNGDFLAFIEDGGYRRPEFWLSDGWDWVNREAIDHPLYWRRGDEGWEEYHLGGWDPLQAQLPVSHVSFYEADAFARWRGARLPTEYELERFQRDACDLSPAGGPAFWAPGQALLPAQERAADRHGNGLLWQWTRSAYEPYPGFRPAEGALGEYNGKFMCDQYVLRGGCVATPRGHLRHSYRNFFRAWDRWPFTGIRLARDC